MGKKIYSIYFAHYIFCICQPNAGVKPVVDIMKMVLVILLLDTVTVLMDTSLVLTINAYLVSNFARVEPWFLINLFLITKKCII